MTFSCFRHLAFALALCGALVSVAAQAAGSKEKSYQELGHMSTSEVQQLADQGQSRAKLEMAVRYASGNGVDKDPARAIEIVRDFAAKNDGRAMYLLGSAYMSGMGVEKDSAQALQWLKRSAEQGDCMGEYWFGRQLAAGQDGGPADWARARPWFEKAAARTCSDAAVALGAMYEEGRGVKKDPNKAAKWYRRAIAIDNNMQAQSDLATLIANKETSPRPDDPKLDVNVKFKQPGDAKGR